MKHYFAGLALGLALIMPIGAQNVFIVNQGLMVGTPPGAHGRDRSRHVRHLVGWRSVASVVEGSPVSQGLLLAGSSSSTLVPTRRRRHDRRRR